MDKSSTFLALFAIISILAIASIAINDISDLPLRQPFPSSNALVEAKPQEFIPDSFEQAIKEVDQRQTPSEEETNNASSTKENAVQADEQAIADDSVNKVIVFDLQNKLNLPKEREPIQKTVINSDKVPLSGGRFSVERLRAAGIIEPVSKKMPYDGMLFDEIEISSLASFGLQYEQILTNEDVLELYSFAGIDKELASEVFDLIKFKAQGALGVNINETNEAALASFFVNFLPPKDRIFLVVKYPDSVYALSYPRSEIGSFGLTYHEIFKKLL